MSERDARRATVHWIGTGLSTGSGLTLLAGPGGPADKVVVWGRTADKAAACASRLNLPDAVEPLRFSIEDLRRRLTPGDVVVSMLPAAQHAAVLSECISRGAHFACTSYTSEDLRALAVSAQHEGLAVLTEAGLDPGIDHLLAHVLISRAREALGNQRARISLTSYCGGVPAVANDFRYRFSWAPRGVLTALLSPARWIEAGATRTAEYPWEAVRPHRLGAEDFEVYPNRDSVPFIEQYGIPEAWGVDMFVRGTLRLAGWKNAWAAVFAILRAEGAGGVDALATDLAARYPTTGMDRDRVVLSVELDVRTGDGRRWSGSEVLDVVGTDRENAMALCVSLPVAVGVARILDGALPAGLNRAAESAMEARRWLELLGDQGMRFRSDAGAD